MKKHLLLLCILLGLVGTRASAALVDFVSNGIYYSIIAGTETVEVTEVTYGSSKYSGNVSIPGNVSYNGKSYPVKGIGTRAFKGCTNLTSVTIPNSVEDISWESFANCTGLTSITLPNSVKSIGNNAFDGCTGLISITLPNSISFIRNETFYGCTGLTNITIPNSVTTIFHKAFYGCTKLTSINLSKVETIEESAFQNCSSLTTITMPSLDEWTLIGKSSFENCTSLRTINFPSAYTAIYLEDKAFKNCKSLTSVIFPNISSMCSISKEVFEGCSNLTHVEFNTTGWTILYPSAFKDCSKLSTITLKCGMIPNVHSEEYTFPSDMFTKITLKVPQGTSSQYKNADFWKNFRNIQEITDSGSSVIYVNNISLDKNSHTMSVGDVVTLTATVSPNNATNKTISWSSSNTSVATVDTNGKVTAKATGTAIITATAADGSNVTKSCTITVTGTGGGGSGGGSESYSYDFVSNGIYYSIIGGTQTVEVTAGPSNYSGNVVIPGSVTYNGKSYPVKKIATCAFKGCTNLLSVTIPNPVEEIYPESFYGCTKLQTVKFPSSLRAIYNSAFEGCIGITSLQFSDFDYEWGIYVGSHAFKDCTSLTSFVTPNGPTINTGLVTYTMCMSFANEVFQGCTKLQTVELNSYAIYSNMFAGCSSLKSISLTYSLAICTLLETNDNPFSSSQFSSITLYVPNNLVDSYKTHSYWKQFKNIVGKDFSGSGGGGSGSEAILVNSISLNMTSYSMTVGNTVTLSANVYPTNATNKTVKWSSSNTSVATVDTNGKVTAKAAGTAIITATAADGSNVSGSCTITVKNNSSGTILVNSITLSMTSHSMTVGSTVALTAYVFPSNANNKGVKWSSSNTSVATVDTNGKVTAKAVGTAIITATAKDGSNVSGSCTITVKSNPSPTQNRSGDYTISYDRFLTDGNSYSWEPPMNFIITIWDDGRSCHITNIFGIEFTDWSIPFTYSNRNTATTSDDTWWLFFLDKEYNAYTLGQLKNSYIEPDISITFDDAGNIHFGDLYIVYLAYDASLDDWPQGTAVYVFENLTATPIPGTSIDEITNNAEERCTVVDGNIILSTEQSVQVYNTMGSMVYSGVTSRIEGLSKGMYIVKTKQCTQKVIIK